MMAVARDMVPHRASVTLARIVNDEGSACHPLARRMIVDGDPRELADAAYHLCSLHGRRPGVVEYAMRATTLPLARDWLIAAAAGFALERSYLVTLAAAAGPAPSTPGQAESEAAMVAQQHTIDTLAQSARPACALGAAIGLMLDWPHIRAPLDAAAIRLGIEVPLPALPVHTDTDALIDRLASAPLIERALTFGLRQLAIQHHALWDLLDIRAAARR